MSNCVMHKPLEKERDLWTPWNLFFAKFEANTKTLDQRENQPMHCKDISLATNYHKICKECRVHIIKTFKICVSIINMNQFLTRS